MIRSLVITAATVILAGCEETQESTYPDLATARESGAITRGWVPDWLPPSARNIKEAHNLDTNNGILVFNYTHTESWPIPSSCSPISRNDLKPPSLRRSWWPQDAPPPAYLTHRHTFFRCQHGFLALSQGEGAFWRGHDSQPLVRVRFTSFRCDWPPAAPSPSTQTFLNVCFFKSAIPALGRTPSAAGGTGNHLPVPIY